MPKFGENYDNKEANDNVEQKAELPSHFEENNKYKLKSSERYEANGYKYETDKRGRITHCEGTLRLDPENDRNSYAQLKAGGEDRRHGEAEGEGKDDGGHLIGRRFGGSKELDNIVAQDSHLNRKEYKAMENEWKEYLEQKNPDGSQKYNVDVDIRCKYKDVREETNQRDSQRPSDIYVYSKVTDDKGNVVDKKIYHFKNEPEDNQRIREMRPDKGGK